MLGVKMISGQFRNLVIPSKSGKRSDPLVDIFLLHQISTYSRRISQARKGPQLGKTVLQGLNSTLYKERHELGTR
jgi:hypothetical protein